MIEHLRNDYNKGCLNEEDLTKEPFSLFQSWIDDAIQYEQSDPTAMVLSTVDEELQPHSRIVLMKSFDENGLIFYTNFNSSKANHIRQNNRVSGLFYWKSVERQVRITGFAEKISEIFSQNYYNSRPFENKISSWASVQSSIIESREELDTKFNYYKNYFTPKSIYKPEFWGGFCIKPITFEFWQGRKNRLHDRFLYKFTENRWLFNRLAP